jgi:hypothetical protein
MVVDLFGNFIKNTLLISFGKDIQQVVKNTHFIVRISINFLKIEEISKLDYLYIKERREKMMMGCEYSFTVIFEISKIPISMKIQSVPS